MNDPDSSVVSEIRLAKWTDRFVAWLIDFIIISVLVSIFTFALLSPLHIYDETFTPYTADLFLPATEFILYIIGSTVFFTYWIVLEYTTGRTVGKMALGLRVTNDKGKRADLKGIILSSFGKSFLLPFDVFFGLFITNDTRQRIFNKIGNTLVLKSSCPETSSYPKYIKD